MSDPNTGPTRPLPDKRRRLGAWIAGGALLLLLAGLAAGSIRDHQLATRLLLTEPTEIPRHADLVSYAEGLAKPAYAKHCVSCHGKDMQGDQAKGAPSLKDKIWLYQNGGVADIERTVLYGIRSGNAKARNITDMPALGRTMQLSPAEVRDVEIYVLAFTSPQKDQAAVQRGSLIFQNKGVCYDCHSGDGSGNPDYGAPSLVDREWLYGGDQQTVFQSIYSGRHGVCPAWTGKLQPKVIRALAVYLHQVSHRAAGKEGSHG